MIFNIGTDIVDCNRIKRLIKRYPKVISRLFTDQEIHYVKQQKRYQSLAFAARFAAKEALLKALGTGMARRITWKQIEILSHPNRKPYIKLSHAALDVLSSLIPPNTKAYLYLSMTDEFPLASATVIIESLTKTQ